MQVFVQIFSAEVLKNHMYQYFSSLKNKPDKQ